MAKNRVLFLLAVSTPPALIAMEPSSQTATATTAQVVAAPAVTTDSGATTSLVTPPAPPTLSERAEAEQTLTGDAFVAGAPSLDDLEFLTYVLHPDIAPHELIVEEFENKIVAANSENGRLFRYYRHVCKVSRNALYLAQLAQTAQLPDLGVPRETDLERITARIEHIYGIGRNLIEREFEKQGTLQTVLKMCRARDKKRVRPRVGILPSSVAPVSIASVGDLFPVDDDLLASSKAVKACFAEATHRTTATASDEDGAVAARATSPDAVPCLPGESASELAGAESKAGLDCSKPHAQAISGDLTPVLGGGAAKMDGWFGLPASDDLLDVRQFIIDPEKLTDEFFAALASLNDKELNAYLFGLGASYNKNSFYVDKSREMLASIKSPVLERIEQLSARVELVLEKIFTFAAKELVCRGQDPARYMPRYMDKAWRATMTTPGRGPSLERFVREFTAFFKREFKMGLEL